MPNEASPRLILRLDPLVRSDLLVDYANMWVVLLGAQLTFLPAQVVAVAFPATVRRARVACAAVAAHLVVQPYLLRELFLHNVGDGHLRLP